MQVQTMDAFFKNGIVDDAILYLEHIPDDYVSGKEELIRELEQKKAATAAFSSENAGISAPMGNAEPMGQLVSKTRAV